MGGFHLDNVIGKTCKDLFAEVRCMVILTNANIDRRLQISTPTLSKVGCEVNTAATDADGTTPSIASAGEAQVGPKVQVTIATTIETAPATAAVPVGTDQCVLCRNPQNGRVCEMRIIPLPLKDAQGGVNYSIGIMVRAIFCRRPVVLLEINLTGWRPHCRAPTVPKTRLTVSQAHRPVMCRTSPSPSPTEGRQITQIAPTVALVKTVLWPALWSLSPPVRTTRHLRLQTRTRTARRLFNSSKTPVQTPARAPAPGDTRLFALTSYSNNPRSA